MQFYNNVGQYIRKFWQQGTDANIDISWEGTGLNMCIAIGSTIFFSNVKPHYKWGWIQGIIYDNNDIIKYLLGVSLCDKSGVFIYIYFISN